MSKNISLPLVRYRDILIGRYVMYGVEGRYYPEKRVYKKLIIIDFNSITNELTLRTRRGVVKKRTVKIDDPYLTPF